jgi:hypothetical protein
VVVVVVEVVDVSHIVVVVVVGGRVVVTIVDVVVPVPIKLNSVVSSYSPAPHSGVFPSPNCSG